MPQSRKPILPPSRGVLVQLPLVMIAALDEAADMMGLSRSDVIRRSLSRDLATHTRDETPVSETVGSLARLHGNWCKPNRRLNMRRSEISVPSHRSTVGAPRKKWRAFAGPPAALCPVPFGTILCGIQQSGQKVDLASYETEVRKAGIHNLLQRLVVNGKTCFSKLSSIA